MTKININNLICNVITALSVEALMNHSLRLVN